MKEFEEMKDMAEFRALSKVSLERQFSDKEYKRFKELGTKLFKNYGQTMTHSFKG